VTIASIFLGRRLLPAALAFGLGVPCLAQGAAPEYDVVSIKPHHATGDPNHVSIRVSISNDRYLGENVTLKQMIQYAYDLKTEEQIVGNGAPGWVDSAHFDVQATIDADVLAALKKLPEKEAWAERRQMMQTMLADRFHLKVHMEKKELPIYELVIAKGGFKLKDADPNNTYPDGMKGPDGQAHPGMMMFGNGRLTGQAAPMQNLVNVLTQQMHRQVMDQTGLTGKYDFTLTWAPDELGGHEAGADQGPSLFTALEEQLGLKLNSTKGLVDTVVIDHAEQPTEN
jgi:uncharacterized protein (TIGR03435 family)